MASDKDKTAEQIDELTKALAAAAENENLTEALMVAARALLLAERWRPRPQAG